MTSFSAHRTFCSVILRRESLKQVSSIHEQKNGPLECYFKNVTNFEQDKICFWPQQTGILMPKRPRSDIIPTFDKRQAFLETQPNSNPDQRPPEETTSSFC